MVTPTASDTVTTHHKPQMVEKLVLPYMGNGKGHGLDCLSECALNFMLDLSPSVNDIEFDDQSEVKTFQGSIDAQVLCCMTRDICKGAWYNYCEGLHNPCGTFWCLAFQVPFCVLVCVPWCISRTRVDKRIEKRECEKKPDLGDTLAALSAMLQGLGTAQTTE